MAPDGKSGFQHPRIVIEWLTMAKRRLNKHQVRRIQRQQQSRSVSSEKEHSANSDATLQLGPEQDGLVVCHFGQQLEIEALTGEHKGERYRCYQRSNLPPLVTGDHVIWQADDKQSGVVVAQSPRKSIISRPNSRGMLRPVAANIDTVVVVIAPEPEPFANLIDRYLVTIENLSLEAVILLNKADLLNAPGMTEQASAIHALLDRYERIGYRILRTSTKTEDGMSALRESLSARTMVFVGQSGVGKSSVINALRDLDEESGSDEEEYAEVGELSIGLAKGTHTTTATRLYHMPGSGDLIDSPGIREFGLDHVDTADLINGFREFRPLLGQCRFRDCKHLNEPGCAILIATEAGEISEDRLLSYQQILQGQGTR